MGCQYFKLYKALTHVANETEEELAKAAKARNILPNIRKLPRLSIRYSLSELGSSSAYRFSLSIRAKTEA